MNETKIEVAVGKPVEDEEPVAVQETSMTEAEPVPNGSVGTSIQWTLQSLTDRTLDFLSQASNETLGACLVGVGAATYLVLGRVGLVIIGVAGGVVLHATWDGLRGDDRDAATKRADLQKRRENSLELAKRVLDFMSAKEGDTMDSEGRLLASHDLDYSSFEPETATALNTFTDAVIKDYVYYWYQPQIPNEETFPAACRRTFTAFVLSLSGHLQRKRPADAFLDFVTNASSIIIVFLNELAVAINASPNSTPADAINAYLTLKPDSSLSYVLDEKSQENKLALISEDILQAYLDPKAYNCAPVHVFLKQVLAQLVLGATVTLCSRPEWINEWIVYGLEESETTRDVMNLVDAGVEGRGAAQSADSSAYQGAPRQEVHSRKEGSTSQSRPDMHRRQTSKAEQAMDEAMQEARRLTQLMIEEDEKRAREEAEKQIATGSAEDLSDGTTQGAPTPSSSQSDQDRHEDNSISSTTHSKAASIAESPVISNEHQQFTSFDQLTPASRSTALDTASDNVTAASRQAADALTLHKAKISLFDDSNPKDKASMKAKPTTDYLIQIEPSSSFHPGWMIARKYADFEMLHEVLRRISVITGVQGFVEAGSDLPKWKAYTKVNLRTELERYLTNAVRFQPLAESEGMKRFLEKDQGLSKSPSSKSGLGWPTPDAFGKLGGDVMNVLAKAPKQVTGGGKVMFDGVAGGGKAVFGGVAGLVGGAGSKRQSQLDLSRAPTLNSNDGYRSQSNLAEDGYASGNGAARTSQDSFRPPPDPRPRLDRNESTASEFRRITGMSPERPSQEYQRTDSTPALSSPSTPSSRSLPPVPSTANDALDQQTMKDLPPPPSEMPADYGSPLKATPNRGSVETFRSSKSLDPRMSSSTDLADHEPPPMPPRPSKSAKSQPTAKAKEPISESETSVAVELMFAVITELYTLSSAWNIRRTLLQAAKTYLLRPGNPQLATIQEMLQTSLLEANLSDAGMAGHIYKLRENGLPTTEELEIWARDYPEKDEEQKEELRVKARRLLVTKGMPVALQSVMGAAASGEALGKVFDCLQVPAVSRGLIFGLMLQALRVVTH